MTHVFIVLSLITFLSCTANRRMMDSRTYHTINVGTTTSQVIENAGSPYEIEKPKNGIAIYRYVERIQIGPDAMAHNTYLLYIADGKVIHKEVQSSGGGLEIRFP